MVPHTHFPAGSAHNRWAPYAEKVQHSSSSSSSSQHTHMHHSQHQSSTSYRPLSPPLHPDQHPHKHNYERHHHQHNQDHQRSASSSSYAPPEPTPPDSGRSKTIREHDLNLLVRQKERGHHIDQHVQDSTATHRKSSSPSSTEYLQNGYMDENDVPLDHQYEEEQAPGGLDDEDTPMGRPQLLDWQSDEDEPQHHHRSRLHSRKRSHHHAHDQHQHGFAPSRQSSAIERSASGSSAGSSSGFSSPRHRPDTWSSNGQSGCRGMQIPIRDTPNNPFLGSTDQDNHRGGLFDPQRRRTGRGEDAARAQSKGYVTCVFRGQRILQLDVASDDSDEEDLFLAPNGAPRGRLQPKLLFPEAHAQEQRRARQRRQEEQERLRQQHQRYTNIRMGNAGHYPSRQLHPHSGMSSSISMPSHIGHASSSTSSVASSSRRYSRGGQPAPTTSGNLFASQIRQRELERERELHRSQEERSRDLHRQEYLRSKSSRQIADYMNTERDQSKQSKADPRLLATLARAGWDSDEEEEHDEDGDDTAREAYDDSGDGPYPFGDDDGDADRSYDDTAGGLYVGYHYRPPVPEDYDDEIATRAQEQNVHTDDIQTSSSTQRSEEDDFWMGREADRSSQTSRSTTQQKRAYLTRRQTMAPMATRYDDREPTEPESSSRRLAPIRSQSSTHLYRSESSRTKANNPSFQRPSLTARMSINTVNKRAWDGAFREPAVQSSSGEDEVRSSTDSDDPFNSRPTLRKGRTSIHNGLPICNLPSRSISSQNLSSMTRTSSSTAMPTGSMSSLSQQSDNPFDLELLTETIQEHPHS